MPLGLVGSQVTPAKICPQVLLRLGVSIGFKFLGLPPKQKKGVAGWIMWSENKTGFWWSVVVVAQKVITRHVQKRSVGAWLVHPTRRLVVVIIRGGGVDRDTLAPTAEKHDRTTFFLNKKKLDKNPLSCENGRQGFTSRITNKKETLLVVIFWVNDVRVVVGGNVIYCHHRLVFER